MKFNLLSVALVFALVSALVAGCASHPSTPEPVTPAVVPTVPAPAPVPVPTPEVEPEAKEELTPEGRIIVKNGSWELDVPGDAGWRPMRSRFTFAMVNPGSRTLVLLDVNDSQLSLTDYVKSEVVHAQKASATTVSQKKVTVNGVPAVRFEVKVGTSRVISWLFASGTETFSLGCGGEETNAKVNAVVCEDVASHFFVGKKS